MLAVVAPLPGLLPAARALNSAHAMYRGSRIGSIRRFNFGNLAMEGQAHAQSFSRLPARGAGDGERLSWGGRAGNASSMQRSAPMLLIIAYILAIIASAAASYAGAILSMLAFGVMGFIVGATSSGMPRSSTSSGPVVEGAPKQVTAAEVNELTELLERINCLEKSVSKMSLSNAGMAHGIRKYDAGNDVSTATPSSQGMVLDQTKARVYRTYDTSSAIPHPELHEAMPRNPEPQLRNDYSRWQDPDPRMRQDSPQSSSRMRERILFCFGVQGLAWFGVKEESVRQQTCSADSEKFLLRNKRYLEDTLAKNTCEPGEMDK